MFSTPTLSFVIVVLRNKSIGCKADRECSGVLACILESERALNFCDDVNINGFVASIRKRN